MIRQQMVATVQVNMLEK